MKIRDAGDWVQGLVVFGSSVPGVGGFGLATGPSPAPIPSPPNPRSCGTLLMDAALSPSRLLVRAAAHADGQEVDHHHQRGFCSHLHPRSRFSIRHSLITPLHWFALQPDLVIHRFYVWQLVTYLFLHGGWFHIIFNMFALWMFGSDLESKWGGKKFLFYYFLTGIGAGILDVTLNAIFRPGMPIGHHRLFRRRLWAAAGVRDAFSRAAYLSLHDHSHQGQVVCGHHGSH